MQADLVDYMGSDLTVVNAARVSFDKHHDELTGGDVRLLDFLARNGHWTPFAHPQITFRIIAPIFVARQLDKHQSGLVKNEVSRRYVDDEPEFWQPDTWREKPQNAKQGSSGVLDQPETIVADAHFSDTVEMCRQTYHVLLDHGVAPEQARAVLPQAMYTSWYWTGSLYAFARICYLRLDEHAQQETGMIAQQIYDHCQKLYPYSWSALHDRRRTD